jgi:diaminohydroxyphosphoribosylaminopyrimidine deaminase / 5-amino-6-(5-phosphoribosylamino)uracil reductase
MNIMVSNFSLDDVFWMRNALAMGRRHMGMTFPNPSVGAVIIHPDQGIVGRGITQRGGRPHAERAAFAKAGVKAAGASLYVTLEPCSHQGQTPPCTEAIIQAGIVRVVSAMTDPDPRVAGRGHAALKRAGIAVTFGVLEEEARRDHQGHILRVLEKRPLITLKLAQTQNGYAGVKHRRLMITGEEARNQTHLMRLRHDAILVGSGTVLADNPRLNVRLPGLEDHSPHKIVLDSTLKIPLDSSLVQTADKIPLIIITTFDAPEDKVKALIGEGVTVVRLEKDAFGRVKISEALEYLATSGITRLFCEGGPILADALTDHVDEIITITSPYNLQEGEIGIPAMSRKLKTRLSEDFTRIKQQRVGQDMIETFSRKAWLPS